MKKLLKILLILLSLNICASEVDDIFGEGEQEFEFERFSDKSILLAIDEDAKVACSSGGLCTLHSVTNRYGGFEVSFNIGGGSQSNINNGEGSVTNIYTGDRGSNCNGCDQRFWGISVKYKKGKCTQTIKVPRSVYYAINRYMYGLMTDTGGVRRGFTPAAEAMIMFYTTIMNKASGCSIQ